jgi:hypothetical protein
VNGPTFANASSSQAEQEIAASVIMVKSRIPRNFLESHSLPQSSKHRHLQNLILAVKLNLDDPKPNDFDFFRHDKLFPDQNALENSPRSVLPSDGNFAAADGCSGDPTDRAPGRSTTEEALPREGP